MTITHTEEVRGKSSKRPRLYGHIHTLDTGVRLYMARRRWAQVFRSGKGSISSAMSEDVACWAIDEMLLIGLRAKGIKFVGVDVIDVGDQYLAPIKLWFSRTSKLHDYTGVGRGGSRQRLLPLTAFSVRKGVVTLGE